METRNTSLDWFRAICILCIILVHVFNRYEDYPPGSARFASFGIEAFVRLGLTGFFVLSGFLLIRSYEGKNSFADFYIKRASRILPLFVFWSYIYFIYASNSYNILQFLAEIISRPIYYHLWFIYALIGIYIVTPFLANIIIHAHQKYILSYCLFSIILYTFNGIVERLAINEYFLQQLIPFWLTYFIGGYCLKNLLEQKFFKNISTCKLTIIFFICISMVFLLSMLPQYLSSPNDKPLIRPYDSNIFIWTATMLFFAFIYNFFVFPLPPIVKFISQKSYGIYLSHALFLNLFDKWFAITPWYLNAMCATAFVLGCCLAFELLLVKACCLRGFIWRWLNQPGSQNMQGGPGFPKSPGRLSRADQNE